jgi:hypothetical protein
LATHEKWEAYIARKKGYNLYKKAQRKYKEDHGLAGFSEERKKEFFSHLQDFRYEFRHEYAIYKEYEQAMQAGRLETYHSFLMQRRVRMIADLKGVVPVWMENDTQIRESILEKLQSGSQHYFTR